MSDRAYLRKVQYRDDTNLNARAALHERFSVNPVGLQRWIFDQLELPRLGSHRFDFEVADAEAMPHGRANVRRRDRESHALSRPKSAPRDRRVRRGVETRRCPVREIATDPDAVVAYVLSMSAGHAVDREALRRDVAALIERDGCFRVSKATGMFVARSPLPS